MKRIGESSRGYLRRNLFRKYVLSMRRGIKIFRFLHGLVMEALSRNGSSFWREWFDSAVRDAHYSARKAFFLSSACISSYICISKVAAFIDNADNRPAKIKIFPCYQKPIFIISTCQHIYHINAYN